MSEKILVEIGYFDIGWLKHWGGPVFNITKDQSDNIYLKSSGLVN